MYRIRHTSSGLYLHVGMGAAVQKKIADRAARPISGDAGDLTATLPGLEGASDIPLFTENDVGRVAAI